MPSSSDRGRWGTWRSWPVGRSGSRPARYPTRCGWTKGGPERDRFVEDGARPYGVAAAAVAAATAAAGVDRRAVGVVAAAGPVVAVGPVAVAGVVPAVAAVVAARAVAVLAVGAARVAVAGAVLVAGAVAVAGVVAAVRAVVALGPVGVAAVRAAVVAAAGAVLVARPVAVPAGLLVVVDRDDLRIALGLAQVDRGQAAAVAVVARRHEARREPAEHDQPREHDHRHPAHHRHLLPLDGCPADDARSGA